MAGDSLFTALPTIQAKAPSTKTLPLFFWGVMKETIESLPSHGKLRGTR